MSAATHNRWTTLLPGAARLCRPIRARLHDGDPVATHAITRQSGGGCAARDDHEPHGCKRAPLARLELGRRVAVDSGLGREGMMHERDQPQTRLFALDLAWHGAEREPVDEHGAAIGDRRELARRVVTRRR